jgi:hypothetical protein
MFQWLCLYPVNLIEAVELLNAVSDYDFGSSKDIPDFSIYDNQQDGFVLCVKASLVDEEYRDYLKGIVESNKLEIRESDGYLTIYGC